MDFYSDSSSIKEWKNHPIDLEKALQKLYELQFAFFTSFGYLLNSQ